MTSVFSFSLNFDSSYSVAYLLIFNKGTDEFLSINKLCSFGFDLSLEFCNNSFPCHDLPESSGAVVSACRSHIMDG